MLVILFAVYAFSAASTQGSRAFRSDGFGPVLGHLLLAVVDIAAACRTGLAGPHRAGARVRGGLLGDFGGIAEF